MGREWSSEGILRSIATFYRINPQELSEDRKLTKGVKRAASELCSEASKTAPAELKPTLEYLAAVFKPRPPPEGIRRGPAPERAEAREILKGIKELDGIRAVQLRSLLAKYLERLDQRFVLLLNPITGKYAFVRPKHRFRRGYLAKTADLYEAAWRAASRIYKWGVFITFTIDPKAIENLVEARVKAFKAFHRFTAWLRKRKRKGAGWIDYVAVVEYQRNGRIHLHVVVFGIRRVADYRELNELLPKWGFGRIHYLYVLRNAGDTWVWARRRPKGARGYHYNPKDYMKKYLKKSLFPPEESPEKAAVSDGFTNSYSPGISSELQQSPRLPSIIWALHWALNTRFFTMSRRLRFEAEDVYLDEYAPEPLPMIGRFVMVYYGSDQDPLPLSVAVIIQELTQPAVGPPNGA